MNLQSAVYYFDMDMRMRPKLLKLLIKLLFVSLIICICVSGAIIVSATLLNMLAHNNFRPLILPFPSASQLGQDFLQTVVDNKKNSVCSRELINQFGGAETKNISVTAQWSSGNNSDHEFEITTIKFEYRKQVNQPWQKSNIHIVTASNIQDGTQLPFRTYICAAYDW
jgi:hypothetical protein